MRIGRERKSLGKTDVPILYAYNECEHSVSVGETFDIKLKYKDWKSTNPCLLILSYFVIRYLIFYLENWNLFRFVCNLDFI